MITEQHITLTAKLYKMRVTAQRLFGEDYKSKTSSYKAYIKEKASELQKDLLEVAIDLANEVKDVDDSGVGTMLIFSAAIDLIENK